MTTRHAIGRTVAAALVACLTIATSLQASANNSLFRLLSVKPHPSGATVRLAMIQRPSACKVTIYVANQPQTKHALPEGYCLGQRLLETGTHELVLDYQQTGLKAGDTLYMAMKWPSGHCWGLAGGDYARPVATLTLPAAGTAAREVHAQNHELATGCVNVNTATKAQLLMLPGVTPVLADRIIAARQHKPFNAGYDLTRVSGIGRPEAGLLAPFLAFTGETTIDAKPQ